MTINIKAELQIASSCRAAFMLCMGAGYLQNKASGEGDTEFAMLPIMDLLNHNSSTGTTVSHSASTQLQALMQSNHLMTCGSHHILCGSTQGGQVVSQIVVGHLLSIHIVSNSGAGPTA